jgi:hypothetical protein
MIRGTPALVLALTVFLNALLFAKDTKKPQLVKPELQIETDYGKFLLTGLRPERNGLGEWVLFGNVTNSTDRNWRVAEFEAHLLDDAGQLFKRRFSLRDFSRGATKPIMNVTGDSEGAELGFPTRKGRAADLNVFFLKDDSILEFAYVLSMVKPERTTTLLYDDAQIRIQFSANDLQFVGSQLQFSLENKTDSPAIIDWDRVSYVDPSKESHRVIHKGVRLIDLDKPQASTAVPPGARLEDLISPSDYVESNIPFLPLHEPQRSVGLTFSVYMPIEINGEKKDYVFAFTVDHVEWK